MAKKFNNTLEAVEYLRTLPMDSVIKIAADALVNDIQKIPITEELFKTHFRIIGTTETGEKETRGRKPKEK